MTQLVSDPTEMREVWAVAEDFNPLSRNQVMSYLTYRKIPIPKHRTTKKPTTNNESLKSILTRVDDPALGLILDARHYKKAEGYMSDTMMGRDGRIHPLYTIVKTGRLASRRPNLMNIPQGRGSKIMEAAAQEIRNSFLADDDFILVELDWRAIEPQLVGWFANDPDYMRVARLGSHAFVLSHYIGAPADLSLSDKELGDYLDGLKTGYPDEYKTVKIANNAFNYKQGLYNMAKTLGKSVAETRHIRSVIEGAFPKIVKWQETTMLQAHAQGRLTNPFGGSLTFFNVLEKDGRPGRESSECLAYLPQSTGAGMLRSTLVDLFATEGCWRKGMTVGECTFALLIPTHDSITLEVRKKEAERIVSIAVGLMEKKWPELDDLAIEVEVKWGEKMGRMKRWKIQR